MYKVCWLEGCSDVDLLARMDDAINDGVDLISISIGGPMSSFFDDAMSSYLDDPIAIGAFHTMMKRILTTCSARNDDPYASSVANTAPWIMIVGASAIDRQFSTLVLSVNTFSPKSRIYPLPSAGNAAMGKDCACKEGASPGYLKSVGLVGMIITLQEKVDTGFSFTLPAVYVDANNAGCHIQTKTTRNAAAPFVASFSSRGPANVSPTILKVTICNDYCSRYKFVYLLLASIQLDIVAPGVDILACYSKLISITGSPDDNQVNVYNIISGTSIACPHVTGAAMFHLQPDIVAPGVDIFACYSKLRSITGSPDDNQVNVYNIISGTSIACPHVTGAAAHVKTFHPNWSPIAIKSALMTTVKDDHAELAYGAGHIDPIRALQPGLIYNSSKFDYARFLCNEDYTGIAISLFTNENTSCSSLPNIGGQDALNYPSMSLQLNNPNSSISTMFRRKVTNVGSERAIYKAIVKAPTNLKVTVVPKQLAFSHLHEEKYFMVVKKGPPLNNISSLSA
ncbi:subtilisin-like protease sbt4.15 [Quercus suber]|uniref:Subtilisin-like protease sbt4.15 n=1 Tax=Quercus suber TaxID=58331 RepID=A0AAW0LCM0_QUESU